MRSGAVAFLVGLLLFHGQAALPERDWAWVLLGAALLLYPWRWSRLPAWLLAGYGWGLLCCLPPFGQFPPALEGTELRVSGWIASLPQPGFRRVAFDLVVESLHQEATRLPFSGKLRLSWYQPPVALQVGDKWEFTVRLRRPHRLANPGSYDEERWLYLAGIAARGTVRSQPEPRLLAVADRYPLDRFRQTLAAQFAERLPHHPQRGILTALAIGEERGITAHQWRVLQRTGTAHFISVSGLHIGLVAGLVLLLIRPLWSAVPWLALRWPAPGVAALMALAAATGYALLAGLPLPTLRSLGMLAVVLLAVFTQRPVVPSRVLALALLVALLLDPTAPLTGSFWLSFGGVAALAYAFSGRHGASQPQASGLRAQWVVTLALLPAGLILFQQIPLLSPLANLVAIPWTSVTVVPPVLLAAAGGFSATWQSAWLNLAALSLDGLWQWLEWLSRPDWVVLPWPAPPGWTLLFALPGLLWLLAPRGLPARWVGGVLLLPLLFWQQPAPPPGAVWFTLLDVGDGLAAVVRTAGHVLVYDTGPRLGDELDAGKAVLVPFLRQQGVNRIDTLIVSHDARSHSGGVRSLREAMATGTVLTPSVEDVPINEAEVCRAGNEWTWDGVRFRLLHPPEGSRFRGASASASCVLLVEGPERLLLAGGIGPAAARALVRDYGNGLAAAVLVAPVKSGAKLPAVFRAAVQPRYVLFAAGRRWQDEVAGALVEWQTSGATVLDTFRNGAISFRFDGSGLPPDTYRQSHRYYWNLP
jgi:competence protein ComEC